MIKSKCSPFPRAESRCETDVFEEILIAAFDCSEPLFSLARVNLIDVVCFKLPTETRLARIRTYEPQRSIRS
jgi:hypothetical protein